MAEAAPHTLLNAMSAPEAKAALERCCGSSRWVQGMLARRPFASEQALFSDAKTLWATLERGDFLEAFSHHPQIGADPAELSKRFARTAAWSSSEQARVQGADPAIIDRLARGNARYLARFGFIFIVCASAKSAEEMLELLEARIDNDPDREISIAAAEQAKITRLRLEKLAA
jgi:2-oxo-4-hydroxy-4-carboxy-5-ureidoimidazoline decarboxylase